MRTALIVGIVFMIFGGAITYIQNNSSSESFITFPMIIGVLFGAGLGLIVGSIMGYNSKARSVKLKQAKIKQEAPVIKAESENTSENTNL
ncbi:hypothetical protein O2K51_06340 [Apibacter raozihei]|uniref:hypothetical protein n=1 Tax=Apibacter TaxID=1778601 RepID=UPI000FE3D19D|nr:MULTISPECIES: hypothetical protein [Apibacter]